MTFLLPVQSPTFDTWLLLWISYLQQKKHFFLLSIYFFFYFALKFIFISFENRKLPSMIVPTKKNPSAIICTYSVLHISIWLTLNRFLLLLHFLAMFATPEKKKKKKRKEKFPHFIIFLYALLTNIERKYWWRGERVKFYKSDKIWG